MDRGMGIRVLSSCAPSEMCSQTDKYILPFMAR